MIVRARIYYSVLLALASMASIFYILQITPTADDYWYAALIRDKGFLGGIEYFLNNQSGFVFKEVFIFILAVPIAYFPIGIGSGVSYLMVVGIFVGAVIMVFKTLSKEFWQSLNLIDKVATAAIISLTYFISNSIFYRNTSFEPALIANSYSYDFTFWVTMQAYYVGTTSLFIFWLAWLEKSNLKPLYRSLNILLFGLAIGTTNYTSVALFISAIILWNLIYFIRKEYVFEYRIKNSIKYVLSIILGTVISFIMPSTLNRGRVLMSYGDNNLSFIDNIISTSINYGKVYFASLANPSLIAVFLISMIVASVFFRHVSHQYKKFLKLGIITLGLSLIAMVISIFIDSVLLFLPWHASHMLLFIKLSALIIGFGLGLKFNKYIESKFQVCVAMIILTILVLGPIYANSSTIAERYNCWKISACQVGHSEDIESEWVYKEWLILKQYLALDDRGTSLNKK